MSGYTPVFRSVFEGSLCGQYPDTAAWLFILALADKNGNVDKTPQYIAAVTGMPVEDLVACIRRFMEPDPGSRTPDDDGRRLVPIDPRRSWGWRIVNHAKYREKARKASYDADRTESGADAARKRAARESVPMCPDVSRAVPLSDTDTDTDTDTDRAAAAAPAPKSVRRNAPAKTPLPDDLALDADLDGYVRKTIPDADPTGMFETFRTQALARGWTHANWRAAFQTYVRNCKPGSGHWAAGQYPRAAAQGGIQWQ